MWIITFRTDENIPAHRKEFLNLHEAEDYMDLISSNPHIHTIMLFDNNGELVEMQ